MRPRGIVGLKYAKPFDSVLVEMSNEHLARQIDLINSRFAVEQTLANYVRRVDERAAVELSELFTEDSVTQLYVNENGTDVAFRPPLIGRQGVISAVHKQMNKQWKGKWGHHSTSNILIDIDLETRTAKIDAQLVVLKSLQAPPPENVEEGSILFLGTVENVNSGYYKSRLREIEPGVWKFYEHGVVLDLSPHYTFK
ncbi:hypothetical protein WALSEDRAFT_59794 [Wallemia mellicola CBS 633.66]|uniref:SnoaL-like domain-containing protein n=2 Tax=Wallemia mellicola TaxID=1708541 RepID=I4YEV8_WALMC|nr:hypothetical protein WALSEDRAFT_59794 [Wallemia mellicola CBS 633.66]EIM22500.1 hypothetical protein WALSEDRAFT_59794 [Wallemia mellicola CBS 633.66]TIC26242.1 hypothetical protein E3Q11_03162 [Wallemia mellicola]TIC51743.1 hypothetical protein E3Q05_03008 [Wallemia mellicola]TIC63688.1 hypothetical protein E3Q01_03218 [Wallemia mellicola]|eukprot:XP_006957174.1 hypothetical protein WALSEDRAFT_59794 [Wallemia mellicola CBS 633.66]